MTRTTSHRDRVSYRSLVLRWAGLGAPPIDEHRAEAEPQDQRGAPKARLADLDRLHGDIAEVFRRNVMLCMAYERLRAENTELRRRLAAAQFGSTRARQV